ncbi:MAG: MarR family transcriptional regulator [Actinomycetota bacterium]|nr:MarR family transcriptional regulator [Actinomycetota bacterium]
MTADKPGEPDVDYELTRLLRRSRARGLRLAAELDESLDFTSYLVLMAIYDQRDGIRGADLAESFGVHKSTISRSIGTLERLGLVERVADPDDGRAQLLTPSADATRRIDGIRERGHGWLADVLAEWSAVERTAFATGLGRFNDAAEVNPLR